MSEITGSIIEPNGPLPSCLPSRGNKLPTFPRVRGKQNKSSINKIEDVTKKVPDNEPGRVDQNY